MSEWNHSAPTDQGRFVPQATAGFSPQPLVNEPRRKWAMLIAGSIGVFLVGGVLFQIFRAEPGEAGADSANAQRRGHDMSTVLATINGNNVSWRQVADECVQRHGKEILENLINRTIIQQECAKRKIVVTRTEVINEVRRIAAKFKLSPENWYQMLHAERGITPIQYHRDIIWPMLALKKIAGTKVKITQTDLRKAFVQHYGPRVKARIILMDNSRRAGDVHNEVMRDPRNFEQLAMKHSIEPNSKALGGEVPPIPRFGGNQKLEEAAFKLREGQISPVVQIGFNRFVIIKCEGYTKPAITELEKVKQGLHEQLVEEKTQQMVARVFEKLRREARVDNFLTGASTGIRQTSGTKPGTKRIRNANYPLPGNVKPAPTLK